MNLLSELEEKPIIAAVKDEYELSQSLASSTNIVFILFGTIMDIASHVRKVKQAGKIAIVHIDLIEGIAVRDIAVDFIKTSTEADGIISTRPPLIKRGTDLGLIAIQRFFIIDSIALKTACKQIEQSPADAIEILPGIMPKIIKKLCLNCKKPIIAGGLISSKEDVMSALTAGATAVSSTNNEVWFL